MSYKNLAARSLYYAVILAFGFLSGCGGAEERAGIELVMNPGMMIEATTTEGTIKVEAKSKLGRVYTWNGESREIDLYPRDERWLGSLGAYFPGDGEHWKSNHGITRGVLQEGQQHFDSTASASKWINQQIKAYPTVYRNDGLVVSFAIKPDRMQINVEVWQIIVKGKKPEKLEGADDKNILTTSPGGCP